MNESQPIILLKDIRKNFGQTEVLNNINLYVLKNEFVTLLGPSGCGKTTTLRIIGGFETPDSGDIFFEGQRINNLPPYQRNVNTVFQKYALFPHMNVYDNIAFGLKIKGTDKPAISKKVDEMLEMVNLQGFHKRSVDSLSGGQQQRVAIARALVNQPEVLLLDEPLGALDLKLRKEMQVELKNIHKRTGITFVYVTHDQEEALTMSDTIVVMNKGKIQQIGTPQMIYNEPKNAFVADFIGESNIIEGRMLKDYCVEFAGRVFECLDKGFEPNEDIDVVVRPEDIKLVHSDTGMISGVVKSVTFKGVHFEMLVEGQGVTWTLHNTEMAEVGATIGMSLNPNDIHIMKKTARG
ncbi:spermidine/putrescine import ATP-binding protein PotA [Ruminiclostridium hungatei]|uniref:Spermidine/putrescine import ATP-binding protein PotA n=1 Tax=Ruminiclostridium hungatei TaxID=48256 RepID=A0A1V4SHH3_RUMHU|nr:spermidine/putrescine ABC transporter ATP-binding protein [Ruminiclostridium hungatei]OPX42915.1 spermidine/putrescine import ATP-binding protein PotA [Ruminiclostridium hungatei]